jgi:hypothetical protein
VKQANDRFAVYAAAFVLVLFATVAFFIYQSRYMNRDAVSQTYVELKQSIVNDAGVVGRIAVTVQVNEGDEDWLHENEAVLNAHFIKELSTLDIDVLRTQEGMTETQEEFKRRFNLLLKTNKVQAVMVTDLLLQDQRSH